MEPRVNTSKHTNTILSLQCDACLQEQFLSKSEFDSQTRYTRTHIEVAQRKTITLSPALSHLPHTLTVELPMMSSSWVTSWRGQNLVPRTNRSIRSSGSAIPQVCCSPVPRNTQHADTVGELGSPVSQGTPAPHGKGASEDQRTPHHRAFTPLSVPNCTSSTHAPHTDSSGGALRPAGQAPRARLGYSSTLLNSRQLLRAGPRRTQHCCGDGRLRRRWRHV